MEKQNISNTDFLNEVTKKLAPIARKQEIDSKYSKAKEDKENELLALENKLKMKVYQEKQNKFNLEKKTIEFELIRYIYEWRMLLINGEVPDVFGCMECGGRTSDGIKLVHFLKVPEKDHLVITSGEAVLSSKTIAEHHRLIHTILANAERELIIPYNPADKAVPPKLEKKDPNS